ncbi:tripartite tricarboxylate transporter substrate binding protein [Candidatus Berkelbacteria bacterium]|nr:tripartite tricarboxylate transporter substrate binding protein [Candidatus Berkelbacteria bacterium]
MVSKKVNCLPATPLIGFLAGLLLLISAAVTWAQRADFPSKPIRIIVPFATGGAADVVTRIVAQKLTEDLGQQIVVDLRPGAGGNIGTAVAAQAAPDGYTLVMGSIGTHAINRSLYKQLPFDPVKDFVPLSLIATYDNVLVVHPSFPAKSVAELVTIIRQRPSDINYASPGNGTTPHLSAELFQYLTKLKLVHVAYKGGAPAITAVMGGHVPIMFPTMAEGLPHVKGGRLRALGVTGDRRSPNLPDVPTIAEAGVTGYQMSGWIGLLLPAGTPKQVVDQLSREVVRAMRSEDVRKKLTDSGARPIGNQPDEFRKIISEDLKKWATVVKNAGIQLD